MAEHIDKSRAAARYRAARDVKALRVSGWRKCWQHAALGASLAGLSGCAAGLRSASGWEQLTTEHFQIRTDVADVTARDLARLLEETRASLLALGWPRSKVPPSRTDVTIFAHRGAAADFLPGNASGVCVRQPPFANHIVFSLNGGRLPETVAHELSHDLSGWFMPIQPLWFAEGLATYLQSVRYDRDTGKATLGEVPAQIVRMERTYSREGVGVRALLDSEHHPEFTEQNQAFYVGSWLLVYHLLNEYDEPFGNFQMALKRFVPWRTAWDLEFGKIPTEQLDREMSAVLHNNSTRSVVIPETKFEPSVRALSVAETHGALARAAMIRVRDSRALIEREVERALALEPNELLALSARFYALPTTRNQRADLARRAVAGHPTQALSWLMLRETSADVGERDRASARAVQAEPFSGAARLARAEDKLATGHEVEALEDAVLGVRLTVPTARALHTYAIALSANRRCAEAESVAAAALSAASAVERGEWDRAKSSAEIWCSTHDYAGRPRLAPP